MQSHEQVIIIGEVAIVWLRKFVLKYLLVVDGSVVK